MYYKEHCENLREIENAIHLLQRSLRNAISTSDKKNERIYTRILSFLTISWTEVRIYKIAYERNAFTDAEILTIINAKTLELKWTTALEVAFLKAYSKNSTNDLPIDAKEQYNKIVDIIKSDLVPPITLRNKVAHGQWVHAFNGDTTNLSTNNTNAINAENIIILQLRIKILSALASLINDLAVSPITFKRDFLKYYSIIEQNRQNIHKREYLKYCNKLVEKFNQGKIKKISNSSNNSPKGTIY